MPELTLKQAKDLVSRRIFYDNEVKSNEKLIGIVVISNYYVPLFDSGRWNIVDMSTSDPWMDEFRAGNDDRWPRNAMLLDSVKDIKKQFEDKFFIHIKYLI